MVIKTIKKMTKLTKMQIKIYIFFITLYIYYKFNIYIIHVKRVGHRKMEKNINEININNDIIIYYVI